MPRDESYGTKLLRLWAPSASSFGWLLFGLAPLLFFQTFIHEGLHWLTTVFSGGDPTLVPFPHFNTRFGIAGETVNGATLNTAGFPAMPQIITFVILIGLTLVFIFSSPRWHWLRFFLWWWYVGVCIDLCYNTFLGLGGASSPGSDWGQFAADASVAAAVLAWLIWLVAPSHLGWIAFARWHNNRPPGRGFFEFRETAIVFAVLSFSAILFSLLVSDPSIIKWQSSMFIVVFLWQVLSLAWFITYIFWASFRRSI